LKSSGARIRKTEVVYGTENIINRTLQRLSGTQCKIDVCISSAANEGLVKAEMVYKIMCQQKEKGAKIRHITEITSRNLPFCRMIMEVAEVRHMDGIKGNYSIVDNVDYQATAAVEEGDLPSESVLSNVPAFVDQQQFVFDMLWNKAIPAKQRIKEIDQGLKREFIETIQDPVTTQNLIFKVISSATEEIDLLFSTPNTFKRYEREEIIELLTRKANAGIKIRILVEHDHSLQDKVKKLVDAYQAIDIHYLNKSVQTKVTTFLVDSELSLIVELKDDNKENSIEAIGLTTYSNSEPTVLSYASIFETLWLQSDTS
jgi:two-component system sensor histidine kinase VicK